MRITYPFNNTHVCRARAYNTGLDTSWLLDIDTKF